MRAILDVTVPFFALVLCGYLAAFWRVLPQSAIPRLNAFLLYFALPCMLFRFGAGTPFAQLVDPVLMGLYAGCALAMVAFTIATTPRLAPGGPRVDLKNAAFGALVAAFPNTGFMGVPLLVALLGDRAAGPVIGTMLVDLIMTSSLCIALAQLRLAALGADASADDIQNIVYEIGKNEAYGFENLRDGSRLSMKHCSDQARGRAWAASSRCSGSTIRGG